MADHFIMVTTVETDYSPDQRDVENAAWDRLTAQYGEEWVTATRQLINNVSIEVVQKVETPAPADPQDAGIEG
jgi:hypothetical protein